MGERQRSGKAKEWVGKKKNVTERPPASPPQKNVNEPYVLMFLLYSYFLIHRLIRTRASIAVDSEARKHGDCLAYGRHYPMLFVFNPTHVSAHLFAEYLGHESVRPYCRVP